MNYNLLMAFTFLRMLAWPQAGKYSMVPDSVSGRIKNDLYVLASDSMEGRKSGTKGEKRAYFYIIHRFEEIGLTPKGSDSGAYLQSFQHNEFDNTGRWTKNHLSYYLKSFTNFYDFGPTLFSADTNAEGDLVIPGSQFYSTMNTGSGADSSSDQCSKVILLDLIHYTTSDSSTIKLAILKETLTDLFKHKISAVLLWDKKTVYHEELFDFCNPDPMPGPVIYLTRSTAKELLDHPGTRLKISAQKPRLNRFTFHNIIGEINNHAKNTIIIGAHYDHVGKGAGKGRIRKDTGTMYGADDNASGTVGMLELARYYRQSGDTSVNYIFVAFSGEEEGLLGSKFFCDHFPDGIGSVRFMVNFDMIGRLGCEGNRLTVMGRGSSPYWKKLYGEVPHPGFRIKARAGAPEFSDHYPFLKKNIPVMYLTTGLHPQYHTSADRKELINYSGLVDVVKFSEALIDKAKVHNNIPYRKIPGITQFFLTVATVFKEL
jgi:aminopeptidase YwaD